MLYKMSKTYDRKGNYESKEAMANKIAVLFANDQLTQAQYEELVDMLEA